MDPITEYLIKSKMVAANDEDGFVEGLPLAERIIYMEFVQSEVSVCNHDLWFFLPKFIFFWSSKVRTPSFLLPNYHSTLILINTNNTAIVVTP